MWRLILSMAIVTMMLSGCVTLPADAFVVTSQQLARRQIETRRYDGIKEENLLVASSNVLQDLGFSLENSETKLGVITASKQRDATEAGEVVANIIIILLRGQAQAMSKDQTIRVSLVVRPVQSTNDTVSTGDNHFVRITFQRVVRRTDGTTISQTLTEEELYKGFFEKLSKSVFLEAHQI